MTNGRVQVQSIKVKTAHPGQVTFLTWRFTGNHFGVMLSFLIGTLPHMK